MTNFRQSAEACEFVSLGTERKNTAREGGHDNLLLQNLGYQLLGPEGRGRREGTGAGDGHGLRVANIFLSHFPADCSQESTERGLGLILRPQGSSVVGPHHVF